MRGKVGIWDFERGFEEVVSLCVNLGNPLAGSHTAVTKKGRTFCPLDPTRRVCRLEPNLGVFTAVALPEQTVPKDPTWRR